MAVDIALRKRTSRDWSLDIDPDEEGSGKVPHSDLGRLGAHAGSVVASTVASALLNAFAGSALGFLTPSWALRAPSRAARARTTSQRGDPTGLKAKALARLLRGLV
jgi:hypothetical protein